MATFNDRYDPAMGGLFAMLPSWLPGLLGPGGPMQDYRSGPGFGPGLLPPDEASGARQPMPLAPPPMQQMGAPELDGDNNPIPGLSSRFGGAPLSPMPLAPQQPPQQPQRPEPPMGGAPAMPAMPEQPGLLARLAGTGGAIGGMANTLNAIVGGAQGMHPKRMEAIKFLMSRGMDTQTALVATQTPQMFQTIAANMLKPQPRPLTAEEKVKFGLPEKAPWIMGPDGKPSLPEGFSTTLPEVTKDANSNPMLVDRLRGVGSPVAGITPQPKFSDVTTMRKEFEGQPGVKKFMEAEGAYKSMLKSAGMDTPASDLDMVYGLAKLMDPESVVREGEFETVRKSQAIPEQVKGYWQFLVEGKGKLDPGARKAIMDIARNRIESYREQATGEGTRYRDLASKNKFDPDQVVRQFPETPRFQPKATGGAIPPPPPGIDPKHWQLMTPEERALWK